MSCCDRMLSTLAIVAGLTNHEHGSDVIQRVVMEHNTEQGCRLKMCPKCHRGMQAVGEAIYARASVSTILGVVAQQYCKTLRRIE